jgi:She9 / Mdm33 family
MMNPRPPLRLINSRVCRRGLFIRVQFHPSIRHSSTASNDSSANGSPSPHRPLSQRTAEYIDALQLRSLAATQRLNDITGYTSIESLKSQIQTQGPFLT